MEGNGDRFCTLNDDDDDIYYFCFLDKFEFEKDEN